MLINSHAPARILLAGWLGIRGLAVVAPKQETNIRNETDSRADRIRDEINPIEPRT